MTTTMRLSLLATGLVFAAAASAAEPAPPQTPPQEEPAHGYYSGVKVAIDPATGRLRQPTAAEIRELRSTVMPASAAGRQAARGPRNEAEARLTVRHLPGGRGVVATVPEDRMMSLVATQHADGTVTYEHQDVDGHVVEIKSTHAKQPEVARE